MSLVSASSIMGGIKEYGYRGIQQLPIVVTATSLLFTITTGSVAHASLAAGLSIVIPLYTYVLHVLLRWLFSFSSMANSLSGFTRATGDTCNLVQKSDSNKLSYLNLAESFNSTTSATPELIPSYWLMSVSFFIGYTITNAIDSLMIPAQENANPENIEKRTYQAIYNIVALSVFSLLVLGIRLGLMSDCEGRGKWGIGLSIVFAIGSMGIGRAMYNLSRTCGGRASDLLGILSQILPASSTAPHPIVCTQGNDD